jgi:TNF receptor-associated protein 1
MSESTPEKHVFQAEIQQLLDLVVHSLYTDKEIFLRELISNASDAMEKLRHVEATEKNIHQPTLPLEIHITTDEEAKTLTIADHGIGMSHDELVKNLGTIAHSGTKAFLKSVKDGGGSPGQHDRPVRRRFLFRLHGGGQGEVHSRMARRLPELVWTSDGKSGYEIEETSGLDRGSKLVLHLKEDCAEYATETRVKHLIETYSNFVGFPILLNGKRINEVEALWLKNKSEISDEQYKAFYQFACKAWDEPAYRLHFSADAPIAINALVFAPIGESGAHGLRQGRARRGALQPQGAHRCLAQGPAAGLDALHEGRGGQRGHPAQHLARNHAGQRAHPQAGQRDQQARDPDVRKGSRGRSGEIPRFLQEVRPLLQGRRRHRLRQPRGARQAAALRILAHRARQRLRLHRLCRPHEGRPGAIYYLVGASREQIESSPYLEAFKARGLEVIYFTDAVDEYVVDSLGTFDGKKLVSIRHGGVELEEQAAEGESLDREEQTTALCEFLKEELGDRVTSVSSGKRLVDSPVIALVPADGMSPQMRQMMKAMDENFKDEVKVELEINPRHPLVRKLAEAKESNPNSPRSFRASFSTTR